MTNRPPTETSLVYRQTVTTRITHWLWAICLFFLLLSGLQIFMARPDLYLGLQSGFGFENTVLSVGATRGQGGELAGHLRVFGTTVETTGWLGVVSENGRMVAKSFPGWLTIPGYRDLATGRIVHFFFAWALVVVLLIWLVASALSGHLRQVLPGWSDIRGLPRDVADHLRLRLHEGRGYGTLQKWSYAGVLFVALPLMVLTGLTMSPGINAYAPWMLELFGGRQTARTIHFAVMVALVLFVFVHLLMVVLAGPFNELRSMTTGWFRIREDRSANDEDRD